MQCVEKLGLLLLICHSLHKKNVLFYLFSKVRDKLVQSEKINIILFLEKKIFSHLLKKKKTDLILISMKDWSWNLGIRLRSCSYFNKWFCFCSRVVKLSAHSHEIFLHYYIKMEQHRGLLLSFTFVDFTIVGVLCRAHFKKLCRCFSGWFGLQSREHSLVRLCNQPVGNSCGF